MLLAAVWSATPLCAHDLPDIVSTAPNATFTCAGSLDTRFDAGSGVQTALGYAYENELEHLLLEPGGDVLIYGSFWTVQGQARRGLARLRPNGILDADFAPELHGTVVRAVVRQPDGHLLVGGDFTAVETYWRPNIARLEADGSVDWGFCPESHVDFGEIRVFALQPDGKIIVAGSGMSTEQGTNLVVLRLHGNGTLDGTFVATNVFAGQVRAVVRQADGKILMGGILSGMVQGSHPALVRLNADGTSDSSFTAALEPNGAIRALALQPDGRILVGGVLQPAMGSPGLGLVRLQADGALDPTFNSDVRLCSDCDVRALALDAEGRILIGGRFDRLNGEVQTLVARVNPDGSLDDTFQASIYKYPETGEGEFVSSMALQPDGRLLVAGYLTLINGHEVNSVARLFTTCCDCPSIVALTAPRYWVDETQVAAEIGVARAGDLSRTAAVEYVVSPYPFQPPGSATPGSEFAAPGGTLVFNVGESHKVLRIPIFNDQMAEASEYFRVALHSPASAATLGRVTEAAVVIVDDETAGLPGSVDRSFGMPVEADDAGVGVSQLVLSSEGELLMAGAIIGVDGVERHGLARLRADGTLDPGFAPVIEGRVHALTLLNGGQVLIGGEFTRVNGIGRFNLARLAHDGSLDTTFAPVFDAEVLALAVQSDGKILAGGQFRWVNGITPRNALARLEVSGEVDPSFDVGTGPEFSDGFGYVRNLCMQPDDKVLVGGVFTHFNQARRQHIARLNHDGSVDAGFDPVEAHLCSAVWAMALQPDGKILLSGHFSIGTERGLIRLLSTGALDEGFLTDPPCFYVNALALQADGCILIGGGFDVPPNGRRVGLARLRSDGTLDASFVVGEAGGYGFVNTLAMLPSGQILLGGTFDSYNALPCANLVRLNGSPGGIAPFVARDITDYTVHLLASPPPNVTSYTVEDVPPFGPVLQISEDGVYDPASGRVRFGPFTDHQPRALSYSVVVPPGDCLRPGIVRGFVQADGYQLPIVGDELLGVDEVFPADLGPTDGRVSLAEAANYAAAWSYGLTWPVAPQPITMDLATRAMSLALGDDAYWFEAHAFTNHPALRWMDFGAPFPQCVQLPDPLPDGSVTRQAPTVFLPGVPFTVTIQVVPADHVTSYALEEQVPWNWQPAANDGGVHDEWNNRLKWGPFTDHAPRTLTYQLTPPNDPWQPQCTFGGTASFDGVDMAITGGGTAQASARLGAVFDAELGRVQLTLQGTHDTHYAIDASADLETWKEILVLQTGADSTAVLVPDPTALAHRFYRARRVP